jgi:hypothetical protein
MKKTAPPKQSLFFSGRPFTGAVLVTILMIVSLVIFTLLFFHQQEWITLPFSTLN